MKNLMFYSYLSLPAGISHTRIGISYITINVSNGFKWEFEKFNGLVAGKIYRKP